MMVSNAMTGHSESFFATNIWIAPAVTVTNGKNSIWIFAKNIFGFSNSNSVEIYRTGPSGITNYVSLTGGNIWPYSSPDEAATNISEAVEVAADNNIIIVSAGTYFESEINIYKPVKLIGENGAPATKVSANFNNSCLKISANATVENFTFFNGSNSYGGGVQIYDGKLLNCIVESNIAIVGGGIYCNEKGIISNCVSAYNTAVFGGGIVCEDGGEVYDSEIFNNSGDTPSLASAGACGGVYCRNGGTINNCKIYNNVSDGRGGGVYCYIKGAVTNCEIFSNISFQGAGIYHNKGGKVFDCYIYNNKITNNFSSSPSGAGIYIWEDGFVSGCVVSNNYAPFSDFFISEGGGIRIYLNGTVQNCIVENNYAKYGGGIYCKWGGIVNNCIIKNNTAQACGGLYLDQGGTANNLAVFGNKSTVFPTGGVMFYGGGVINNSTIINNYGKIHAGGISCHEKGTISNSIIFYNKSELGENYYGTGLSINYCCTTPMVAGTGNISEFPMIAGLNNPHITENSPCKNNGKSDAAVGLDIDYEQRIFESNVDIGCDEYIPVGITGQLHSAIIANTTNATVGFEFIFCSNIKGKTSAFYWDMGNGEIISNMTTVSKIFNSPGIYNIILTAYNNDFQEGILTSITIYVSSAASKHYVSNFGNNTYPFTSWETAATNIQDAIDVCFLGSEILVTDGVYNSGCFITDSITNRIGIHKAIVVKSVNGPENTIISGLGPIGNSAVRCAYLTAGSLLSGFTLSNGFTLDGFSKHSYGGGVYLDEGGILSNCTITACSAKAQGGGAFCNNSGLITECRFIGNSASSGGGCSIFGGKISKSYFSGNYASWEAGGARCFDNGIIDRCIIVSNSSKIYAGGALAAKGEINNCLLFSNFSAEGGGAMCWRDGTFNNCTISKNSATEKGGGFYGLAGAKINNSIIYFNSASNDLNSSGGNLLYCCSPELTGTGNITNNPEFLDFINNNFRVEPWSACVDAGHNSYAEGEFDLDNDKRIQGNCVDIGSYEEIPEPVILTFIFLFLLISQGFRKNGYFNKK